MSDSTKSLLHNLKSTLTAIRGYIQLIESGLSNEQIDREKLKALTAKAQEATLVLETNIEKVEQEQA